MRHLTLLLVVFSAALTLVRAADEDANLKYFRDLAETRSYSLGRPTAPKQTPDGAAILFLRSAPRDRTLRLYEFDIASKRERELIAPETILGGAEEVLTPEEKSRRERSRTTTKGFTTFDLSEDGARVLVTLSGKLYVVARVDLKVTALPGQNWIAPKFSPDGAFVAAAREGELYVIEIATLADRQLTNGATDHITHGTADFIAQEEMDRFDGFWWSPDSSSLAYQETDDSTVETRYIIDPMHPEAAPQKNPYPHAGSANPKVRLGVIARDGGDTHWINWDAEKLPYLCRVNWQGEGAPLTILVQDRRQQDERLLAVDPAIGATHELLRETDPAWLNLDDPVIPRWLNGGKQFIWSTERRGFWQLELRDATGALVRELTPLDAGYRELLGVDEATGSVFIGASADPTEEHIWKFPLAGGPGQCLTTGRGEHQAHARRARTDQRAANLVDSFSLLDGAQGVDVLSPAGAKLASLPSVAEVPQQIPRVELTRTGGEHSFYAAIIRPRNFSAGKKYPVLLQVYAGPQTTTVTSAASSYFIDQWRADQGYIVARLDGRGTTLRGRDWQRLMHGNFIDLALQGQVAGLQALGAKYPEMDLTRVGVTGWSFGGYFSAMATIRRPDIFKAGVAGAPVITWENYDTYYTERYMGLPQENPDGYRASSVLTYANQLARPLLLIHGLTDDNVYFQHAVQLADALYMAGKPYEFLPMLGTHMAGSSDPLVQLREHMRIIEFFNRELKP